MYNLVDKMFQNVPLGSSNISLSYGCSVKEMKTKKITIALVLALMLVPTSIINAQVTVETTDGDSFDNAMMNMIRTQALTRKQEMLNLFGEGPYSPDVENCMQNAQQAMEQAQNFEELNPEAASEQYIRALKQYRNAYRKYYDENSELVEDLADAGSASDVIDETPSQEELESAREQLVNRFQERHQEQIRVMMNTVDELEDVLSPQDAEKARQAFMNTLEKSYRILERIQNREFEVALDELDEAVGGLEDELGDLDDESSCLMLKSMNRLESRIQKMIQTRARKAAYGGDTSIEDGVLDELDVTKNQMMQAHREKSGAYNGGQGYGTGSGGAQGNGGN